MARYRQISLYISIGCPFLVQTENGGVNECTVSVLIHVPPYSDHWPLTAAYLVAKCAVVLSEKANL